MLYCVAVAGHQALLVSNRRMATVLSRYLEHAEVARFPRTPTERRRYVEWLSKYLQRHRVDAVVACDMCASALVDSLRVHLRHVKLFPVSGADALDRLHNKWRFARLLMSGRVATPETRLLVSRTDLRAPSLHRHHFPLVVKPLDREGGTGVRVVHDACALEAHVASGRPHCRLPLVAQRFIQGKDIDLSVLAADGEVIAWTIQTWVDRTTLGFSDDPDVLALGEQVVRLARYSGVAHFDMRREEGTGRAYIVECNPRFWMTLQVSLWHGVNFVDAGLQQHMSRESAMARYTTGRSMLVADILKCALRSPGQLLRLSPHNWRGFAQVVLAPCPTWREGRRRVRRDAPTASFRGPGGHPSRPSVSHGGDRAPDWWSPQPWLAKPARRSFEAATSPTRSWWRPACPSRGCCRTGPGATSPSPSRVPGRRSRRTATNGSRACCESTSAR